jgi:hypothetical protein
MPAVSPTLFWVCLRQRALTVNTLKAAKKTGQRAGFLQQEISQNQTGGASLQIPQARARVFYNKKIYCL